MKPAWLDNTNLTRFDVPGLCNEIWHDSTGVACVDTDQMEGCVLGGGTAVNAGLWWKVRRASPLLSHLSVLVEYRIAADFLLSFALSLAEPP